MNVVKENEKLHMDINDNILICLRGRAVRQVAATHSTEVQILTKTPNASLV